MPVTGKVTYNGQPVDGATITFIGPGVETPRAATTAADGAYELRVKPGSYTAVVSKTDIPAGNDELTMEQAFTNDNQNKPQPEPKELFPAKYRTPTESPLKFEVKPSGANNFDLSLTD